MAPRQDEPLSHRRLTGLATLLGHAEPPPASSARGALAAQLAREAGGLVIGVGAEAVDAAFTAAPYGGGMIPPDWLAAAQVQIDHNLAASEAAFRQDAGDAPTEWRQANTFPDHALVELSRAADLIVMNPLPEEASSYRSASPTEVVMNSGRPVLIAPPDARSLRAETVVVGWKDTREARRAVSDAMPFLTAAETVVVTAICDARDMERVGGEAEDVAAMLRRRGAQARTHVTTGADETVAEELDRIAETLGAQLIVTGAYGHSRLSEWVFGGVTRTLLMRPRRFVLASH